MKAAFSADAHSMGSVFIRAQIFCVFVILSGLLSTVPAYARKSDFVTIRDGRFERDRTPYLFVSANFWQGMNLGAPEPLGNRSLLKRELDRLKDIGISQLRVLALSEGPAGAPYRITPAVLDTPGQIEDRLLQGLDFLLAEMGKRGMTAVVVLANFWPWSGGFAQWVSWAESSSIPYPPPAPNGSWSAFQEYASRFYILPKAVEAQREAVRKVLSRINSITRQAYRDDPTIMAWELANEPRGGKHRREFLAWIQATARFIRGIDSRHLITTGSEGETLNPDDAGNRLVEDHAFAEIDYVTAHLWVENWGIYQPSDSGRSMTPALKYMRDYLLDHVAKAQSLKKPLVLEEFGLARDKRSMEPESSTVDRDRYYAEVFEESLKLMKQGQGFSGVGFWSWSGEARPRKPAGGLWRPGDSLLGDPPHEEQGWYGVYDSDSSTISVIRSYSQKIAALSRALQKRHRSLTQ